MYNKHEIQPLITSTEPFITSIQPCNTTIESLITTIKILYNHMNSGGDTLQTKPEEQNGNTSLVTDQRTHPPLLIALDGRCAAGKTTLAATLMEALNTQEHPCTVIHMDHFFLQTHMRTPERLAQPGGNVDYERFEKEVLLPLSKGETFSYQPYNCEKQALDAAIEVKSCEIAIIEGSYSCHPRLMHYYDYKIFLSIEKEKQIQRIEKRNGKSALKVFREKWIPLEELYFKTYSIQEKCDFVLLRTPSCHLLPTHNNGQATHTV